MEIEEFDFEDREYNALANTKKKKQSVEESDKESEVDIYIH